MARSVVTNIVIKAETKEEEKGKISLFTMHCSLLYVVLEKSNALRGTLHEHLLSPPYECVTFQINAQYISR